MYYQKTIDVPANTIESNAVVTRLHMTLGTIERFIVAFPAGCHGLCHVRVNYQGWQILPWTLGESLAWDNYVFDMQHKYPLAVEPYDLRIVTWNEDDSYLHRVFVGLILNENVIEGSNVELYEALAGMR